MITKSESEEMDDLIIIGLNVLGRAFTTDYIGPNDWIVMRVQVLLNKKYDTRDVPWKVESEC